MFWQYPTKPKRFIRNSTSITNQITIEVVSNATDAKAFDQLLWDVLWQPLDLPRDIRLQFKLEGESLELVAKANTRIIGGVVGVWTSSDAVELRHIAVSPEKQKQRVGERLFAALVAEVAPRGCRRIHTIARNTSAGFFKRLGFRTAPGIAPDHPHFRRYGITFELMEKAVRPG